MSRRWLSVIFFAIALTSGAYFAQAPAHNIHFVAAVGDGEHLKYVPYTDSTFREVKGEAVHWEALELNEHAAARVVLRNATRTTLVVRGQPVRPANTREFTWRKQ